MIKNSTPFVSKSEVEEWISVNIGNGVPDEDVLTFLLDKKEELRSNVDFYLKSRRLALITGDTNTATRLHGLLKEAETELSSINDSLLYSFYTITKRKNEQIEDGVLRKNVFKNPEKHKSGLSD